MRRLIQKSNEARRDMVAGLLLIAIAAVVMCTWLAYCTHYDCTYHKHSRHMVAYCAMWGL